MTGFLGYLALAVAFPTAVYGAAASLVGARRGNGALVASGRNAALAFSGLVTLAVIIMETALLRHDFSVGYVAQVGSRSTPAFVTTISLWAALEGSILFWLWTLSLYAALCAWLYRRRHEVEIPYVTTVLLGIGLFFLVLLLSPSNPFRPVNPVPFDGPGPNPVLQNHPLMALHPPAQYLGYVGFSVPFAFAMAALATGHVGAWWVRAVRRWTLMAWIFLTVSILAGGWWAYEVLGWGGYWAWDPVENAALMPWLVGTAFLHSVMVQERREMLRGWNVALIVTAFLLTIFGTFLTRSGVLGSVHAFSESVIGPLFLGFLALVLLGSTAMILWRSAPLRSPGRLRALLSREAAILVGNLLFLALTFTVFLGTVFPLAAEALTGTRVSVGGPYFNRMTVPLLASLIFLMGVGPALPWRAGLGGGFARRFRAPALGGVVAAGLGFSLGERELWPLLSYGLAGFALLTMVQELILGARVRMRRGESPGLSLLRMVARNRRRYGGTVVHAGVIIAAVAVAASWNHRLEKEATLRPGETLEVAGYDVRLDRVRGEEEPHRYGVVADLTLSRNGQTLDRRSPRLNYYPSRKEPVPTPSVRSRLAGDLFLSLTAFEDDGGTATVRAVAMPLVVWLWMAGGLMAVGTLVAVWPGKRSREALLDHPERTWAGTDTPLPAPFEERPVTEGARL